MRDKAVGVLDSALEDMSDEVSMSDADDSVAFEADALQAIAVDWLDESERTSVVTPEPVSHSYIVEADGGGFDAEATTHYERDEQGLSQLHPNLVSAANDLFDDLDHAAHDARARRSAVPDGFATSAGSNKRRERVKARRDAMRSGTHPQQPDEALPPSAARRERVGASTLPVRPSRVVPKAVELAPEYPPPSTLLPPPPPDEPWLDEPQASSANISGSRRRVALHSREQPAFTPPWEARAGRTARERQSRRTRAHTWSLNVWWLLPLCAASLLASAVWARRGREPEPLVDSTALATGLKVSSSPNGAQILLDGRPVGAATPALLTDVAPGQHTVELRLAGYLSAGIPALAKPGETVALRRVALHRIDEPVPAVSAKPALSAAKPVAPTTVASVKVQTPVGPRAVRIERPAPRVTANVKPRSYARRIMEPAKDTADNSSAAGTDDNVNALGTLRVNSRPWARVVVDGRFVGHTPQQSVSLGAGRHQVSLVNEPLHMSKSFEVSIVAGQTTTRVELLDED